MTINIYEEVSGGDLKDNTYLVSALQFDVDTMQITW